MNGRTAEQWLTEAEKEWDVPGPLNDIWTVIDREWLLELIDSEEDLGRLTALELSVPRQVEWMRGMREVNAVNIVTWRWAGHLGARELVAVEVTRDGFVTLLCNFRGARVWASDQELVEDPNDAVLRKVRAMVTGE